MSRPSARNDAIAGLLVVLGGAVLFADTFGYTTGADPSDGPGSAFFPRALALIAIALGCLLVGKLWFRRRAQTSATAPSDPTAAAPTTLSATVSRNALWGAAATVAYAVVLSFNLYFVATPVFLLVILWLCGIRRPLTMALVSLGFVGFVWVVFFHLLGVPLSAI